MKGKFNISILIALVLSVSCQLTQSRTKSCQRPPERCIDVTQIDCSNVKYRKIDGSCNSLLNPTQGMPFTSYRRLLPARYSDDIYAPPLTQSGNDLPSARFLSYHVFGRKHVEDSILSMMSMSWGQAVTHDTSNRISSRSNQLISRLDEKLQVCCNVRRFFETQTTDVPCFPIPVPSGDPFFHGAQCLVFDRTITDKDQKCPGTADPTPAEQLTGATHYLDLSFVYGNSDEESKSLRTMADGLLLTSDEEQHWPPRNPQASTNPPVNDPYAPVDSSGNTYLFGDGRGNQNPGLTIIHIVLLREHNRIARELARYNPHWDDETLFQEARRINIAQYQHITYYEWNIDFIGTQRSLEKQLTFLTSPYEYTGDYNECADPRSIQAFQHSAFRFFHTQIMGTFHLASETRDVYNSSIVLSSILGLSGILEEGCPFSPVQRGCQYNSFVRGLTNQAAGKFDIHFDPEVAENFPVELRAFDLQRDRDHGIASYNSYRELCGLPSATEWEDYADYIPKIDIEKLRTTYESFLDVDLSVGAALERPLPGSVVGPVFTCIHTEQFSKLRRGDRYFFENKNQPHPFKETQLAEIRKSTAARLFCDNTDIKTMQSHAFRKISANNQLLECDAIPRVNLELWTE